MHPEPDPDHLAAFALRVWGYKEGEMVSLMIHLGDRLGLYPAMAGAGAMTAGDLASRRGLQERWLLEWLRSQAAAHLLESPDGSHFELTPEGIAVLADESASLWFAGGAFEGAAVAPHVVDRLADAFRSGIGLTYEELGFAAAHGMARRLGPWSRLALVPRILPALGLVDKLAAGGRVADVGCGSGVALRAMAAAFPRSSFEGWDPSQHAIAEACAATDQEGLHNVSFRRAGAADLPGDPTYDIILTLDCIHDLPRPTEAVAAIRRAIRPDGTWLIKDIRAGSTWAENQRNPLLAMMYAMSVATCLSSALSEPGGAGLGTLGFPPELAEKMCISAGFTRFRVHDFGDPANLYYEVRP
ncbi:MAG: class I SAM-dependent methyltransferase [Acidimicrobiales bacterium]